MYLSTSFLMDRGNNLLMAAANHQPFVLKPLYLDIWKTCLLPSFNLLPDFHTVKCTSPSCCKTQRCHLCTSHLG